MSSILTSSFFSFFFSLPLSSRLSAHLGAPLCPFSSRKANISLARERLDEDRKIAFTEGKLLPCCPRTHTPKQQITTGGSLPHPVFSFFPILKEARSLRGSLCTLFTLSNQELHTAVQYIRPDKYTLSFSNHRGLGGTAPSRRWQLIGEPDQTSDLCHLYP